MTALVHSVRRFIRDDTAATMVEYGIMVALIAAVSIAVVKVIGTKVNTAFTNIEASM